MKLKHLTIATLLVPLVVAIGACGDDPKGTDNFPSIVTSVRVEGSVPGLTSTPPSDAAAKPDACTPLPKPFTDVDSCNAQSVATAALATMYSTDPTHDRTSQDAVLRAVPLLSTAMISRIAAPTSGGQQNTEWLNLKAAKERVVVTVTIHKENLSIYYEIKRKAVRVDASNDASGRPLDTISASPTLVVVDGMGYRLDAVNPIS